MSEDATFDGFVEEESDSCESETEDLARKTVCGIPPQDWTIARLGELVRVVSGNSLTKEYQDGNDNKHPVYKVSDMNAVGNQKYLSDTSNRLSKSDLGEINHTLHPKGTIILPKVGAALLTNKRRILTKPSSFDNNVMGWVPDEINPEFLYYLSCMIDMEAFAQKGAVPSINNGIAKSLKLPSPPLPEQRKIATVLYTVDTAIEKTETILRQKETIKKGVLYQLLQTGIGENETTETKLGPKLIKFPISWEVRTLGDVSTKMRNGFVGTATPHYSDEEDTIPYIQSFNVRENRIANRDEMVNVEPDFHRDNPKTQLSVGDLLTVQSGHIGTSCVVPAEYDGSNCHALIITRFKKNRVNPYFVSQFLNSTIGSDLIKSITVGTTIDHLNVKEFKNMRLPLPLLCEQNKIVETMSDFDDGIENARQYLERLKRLKRGLMQDLLSGTVRTTDTNIEVPDEIMQYG